MLVYQVLMVKSVLLATLVQRVTLVARGNPENLEKLVDQVNLAKVAQSVQSVRLVNPVNLVTMVRLVLLEKKVIQDQVAPSDHAVRQEL